VSEFSDLMEILPQFPTRHVPSEAMFRIFDSAAAQATCEMNEGGPWPFGPFGEIVIPYFSFGNVDIYDLVCLNELIIYAYYHVNRGRYRRFVDFGANVGMHSIVASRCGFEVRSFEPDPVHFGQLIENLVHNEVKAVSFEAAVSVTSGVSEFVRVCDNTTSSHLAGAKANPYGPLERFPVRVEAAGQHLAWADLAKIDIEGHEAHLLTNLAYATWRRCDAIIEVGSPENAEAIFEHFEDSPCNLFSQKIGWRRVMALDDMPTSHRDGSLFLTAKEEMPWPR
jgi:FkbM family methyltransferase